MKTFRITYRDRDPACPDFTTKVQAANREGAIEAFWAAGDPDDDDWKILSVKAVAS